MQKLGNHSPNTRRSVGLTLLIAVGACSSGEDAPSAQTTGGSTNSGGSPPAVTGGNANTGGVNAGAGPSGGSTGVVTGGAQSSAGATQVATGGMLATGGATSIPGMGGGGAGTSTSGGTGGAQGTAGAGPKGGAGNGGAGNGGAVSGGASASGGATNGGSTANGGAPTSGGSKAAGGASVGGAGTGGTGTTTSCSGVDAAEFTLVSGWLNNTAAMGALPAYAYTNIRSNFPAGAAFDKLACSIARSCAAFAPAGSNWLRKCEAVITSAIVAESSYNPSSVVNDAYATRSVGGVTANDPTVGLLQIRFSSTVHDYNFYGPAAKMAAIGCNWPAALTSQADTASWWATNGGTGYLSFMQDVACNIGLATWYYFYNATGNGGASAVWISNYCAGQGVAGTMVIGLLSHLQGGSYARPADANNAYPWGIECCAGGNPSVTACTGCTGRFAAFMGIGTSSARPGPDPFLETLPPEPAKYCK